MGNFLDDVKDWGKESLGVVLGTAGTAFGGAVGGAAGSYLGNMITGDQSSEAAQVPQGVNGKWVRKANRLDRIHQKKSEMQMWRRAQQRGLTAQEYYGSGAAGGVSSPTGNAQVLGNNITQNETLAKQQQFEAEQNQLDRMTKLSQSAMQAEAQKDVALTNLKGTTRGQDVQKEIADNIFGLNKQKLEAELKQAAVQLKISKQELLYKINTVATSEPKFLTAMKQLSMGPANLLTELTMRHHGISLSNKSFENMSVSKRERILEEIVALGSVGYIEFSGAGSAVSDSLNDAVAIIRSIFNAIGLTFRQGIKAPKTQPNLGYNPDTVSP